MARVGYTGIADAKLPDVAPEDRYSLQVIGAEHKKSNKGKLMTEIRIKIMGEERYKELRHYIMDELPEDPEKAEGAQWRAQRFLDLFSIPYDDEGFDTEDFAGATAENVLVTVNEPQADPETGVVTGFRANQMDFYRT